jgi:DNA invertase Pin-like site-specific DNA recombinase
MSTDHQQYSLDNQADAIALYAAKHGFQVVKTYSDAARSGLRLQNRPGLKQLLKDVVAGTSEFRAILVYDVSRWGRFQDVDEAAHYEYLCKSAGVPIHYCAEPFSNDNSTAGLILKALKRTMAGEYSRELSAKVRAGLVRLAKLGYKQGGCPPYGMRRMLLDVHGKPKQLLAEGERKSLTTERVILVPGPENELSVVRRIFREYATEKRSLTSIAKRLNNEKVPFVQGGRWTTNTVSHALERPQYMGTHVWGRTTQFLSGPSKKTTAEHWGVCPNAFQRSLAPNCFSLLKNV